MGSKGSNTTTTNQNQSQSQTYAPTGAGYITNALDRATSAAAQPFAIPQAPVAGFSPDQQQAFQQYRNAQGIAQPYFTQAANYYSPQGAQDFLNPYAANVMAGLKDVFGQQASQNTGNLVRTAGGIGADRIAVGQAELAKQQGLVAGQTLSGLYDNAVRQAQAAGAGQMGLGQAAQNAALTGTNALYGAGLQQQQLEQMRLNAPYQQQLAQAAFPYQQAQFLSGITGALAPSLGGTTSGYSTGTTSKTAPAPSLFSQILGAGTAGVGLLGGTGAFGSDGWLTGGGGYPQTGATYGGYGGNSGGWGSFGGVQYPAFARGGRTDPFVVDLPRRDDGSYGYDDGGAVSDDPIDISDNSIIPTIQQETARPVIPQLQFAPMQQQQESGSGSGGNGGGIGDIIKLGTTVLPMVMSDERLKENVKAVGKTYDGQNIYRYNYKGDPRTQMGMMAQEVEEHHPEAVGEIGGYKAVDYAKAAKAYGGGVYADGGEIDMETPATFDERFPYRMPEAEAVEAWRANAPAPDVAAAPVMAYAGDDAVASPAARAVRAAAPAAPYAAPENPYSLPAPAPSGATPEQPAWSSFASSPWAALVSAGLGMMAGTSPFAGVNIGQGGLQGLKTLQDQREAARRQATIDQAARRLELEAKRHEDQYSRMTPYQKAQLERAERAAAIEALKPVQIGQDAYGRPVYAKRNPKTGEYEEIRPTQEPVPAAPAAPVAPVTAPAPRGHDESALPVNARPTQGLLPNGTFGPVEPPKEGVNPEALEGMRPGDVKLVKAISEGRQKFLPIGRNNPYNRFIMEKVHEYDPSVDETAFSRRSRTANFFAVGTQGGGGQNITAMNTFGQHADELLKISEKLNLGEYPSWNAVKNALAKQGFSDAETQKLIGAWEVAAKAVADEGAKVFAGSQSALADREEWAKKFDINSPKGVTRAKLQEVVKLIEGRLNALTNQYNEGMRTSHDAKDFIAPRTREIFDRIVSGKKEESGKEPSAGSVPPMRKRFKQGWGISHDGGKTWVPEQ